MRFQYVLLSILMFSAVPKYVVAEHAAHTHTAGEKKSASESQDAIKVDSNQAVIEVNGVVCSFCAYGIEKKFSKLPFIDTSQFTNGVHTNIESQQITLALNPDSAIELSTIYKSVRDAGYEPIAIHLSLSGAVVKQETKYTLNHEATNQTFNLLGKNLDKLDLQKKLYVQVHISGDDITALIPGEPIPVFIDQISGDNE